MNRFRNPVLRNQYDQMVLKWKAKHADLFRPDGVPHMGAGGGMAFWLGYQGRTIGAGFIEIAPRNPFLRVGEERSAASPQGLYMHTA